MANKLTLQQDTMLVTMMSQLNIQSEQQKIMQRELQTVRNKLEQASKILAQKDQLIGSLEIDLEHMIDQMVKIKHTRSPMIERQWIARTAPGVATDYSV